MHGVTSALILSLIFTPAVLYGLSVADAQVMESTNFQLQSDSVNFGGGLSSSTNFVQESTFGEVATGRSTSSSFNLNAGYQQMQEVFLSFSGAEDVQLTPDIAGVSGGVSNGSTTVTVITDSPAGYELTIQAENTPAMQTGIGDVVDDYVPDGAVPDYTFDVAANESMLGFTPEGVDTAPRFLNSGTTCGQGQDEDPLACWDGLSTSDVQIARSGSANHPAGATTSIRFRVEVGSSVVQPVGDYTATTTLTAIPL